MTEQEKAFLIDLRDLLEKHEVYERKGIKTFDGYTEPCISFYLNSSYISEEWGHIDKDFLTEMLNKEEVRS